MLWNVLVPKNSLNNGEVVTGEGECGGFYELHFLMVQTAHLYSRRYRTSKKKQNKTNEKPSQHELYRFFGG